MAATRRGCVTPISFSSAAQPASRRYCQEDSREGHYLMGGVTAALPTVSTRGVLPLSCCNTRGLFLYNAFKDCVLLKTMC